MEVKEDVDNQSMSFIIKLTGLDYANIYSYNLLGIESKSEA